MKDSVVRGRLLQFLYERRNEGAIAFGRGEEGTPPPGGVNRRDWFGAVAQLAEYGLIEWKAAEDRTGHGLLQGVARISEIGIKVIEGNSAPPISIVLDRDRPMTGGKQPVAPEGAAEQMSVTEAMEKVITAIEHAPVSEQEKNEARSLLRKLLSGQAAAKVLGEAARALQAKYLKE